MDFDSINLSSDAWHTTDLEVKNGWVKLSYIASQGYNSGTFRVFLTDQDHLTWDALKEASEVKAESTPDSKNKVTPCQYKLDVKLPEGYIYNAKSLLFIIWEPKGDPARETFFSCSDVVLKNANN